jgi:3-oxoacyl-[acyl-carrier protein] reductase
MINLSNKKILVLGASSDIGLSLINDIYEFGGEVVAQGNSNSSLLPKLSQNIQFKFDSQNIDSFFEKFKNNEFDGFVNLVGKTDFCFGKNLQTKNIEEITFLNYTLNLYLVKHLHRVLKINSSTVFISSAVSDLGETGMSHYAGANSAISGMIKSFAKELSYKFIRVNSVKPHLIETRNTAKIPHKIKTDYIQKNLLKRIGTHKDVSDAILFLLSNMSSYITGQEIRINGGSYLA